MKQFLAAVLMAAVLVSGCSAGKSPQSTAQPSTKAGQVVSLSASDLLKRIEKGDKPLIVDVREPHEFAAGHIANAQLIPLGNVEQGFASIPKDQEIILVCRSGNRSEQAYQRLAALGYTNLTNMTGGMLSWEKIGAPIQK